MEAGQIEPGQIVADGSVGITTETTYHPAVPPAQEEHLDTPKFDHSRDASPKMKKVEGTNQESHEKDTSPCVSKCYVFKSRLQEYCQKAGLSTPVYETTKEGPSHEPYFKSSVVVDNVRYDSLPAFFNRKAAEQSAAEIALVELAKSTTVNFGISQPVHETGLCKNLLQEYSQKMNYAIPLYECRKEEKEGRMPMYSCVVEIGGIKYIGASASTKKEAEKKAARTALLAIQTDVPVSEDHTGNSIYTVVPPKKKTSRLAMTGEETKASLKPKKGRFKKRFLKKKRNAKKDASASLDVKTDGPAGSGLTVTDALSSETTAVADVKVDMLGDGGIQVVAIDGVNSQGKTSDGSHIHEDGQRQEPCVTSFVSSNGDSGTNTCSTSCDAHLENAGVPLNECRVSTVMDVN